MFGGQELAVLEEPFNKHNACLASGNMSYYDILVNTENDVNMLTNQKCNWNIIDDVCSFTISEIEVWGVTFNQ